MLEWSTRYSHFILFSYWIPAGAVLCLTLSAFICENTKSHKKKWLTLLCYTASPSHCYQIMNLYVWIDCEDSSEIEKKYASVYIAIFLYDANICTIFWSVLHFVVIMYRKTFSYKVSTSKNLILNVHFILHSNDSLIYHCFKHFKN